MRIFLLVLMLCAFSRGFCQVPDDSSADVKRLAEHVFYLSEVMLHDVASPPAASRIYAYSLLAAYETVWLAKGGLPDLNRKFRDDPGIRAVSPPKNADLSFCSNYAMLEVGQKLMPSGALLEAKKQALTDYYRKKGFSPRAVAQHIRYAEEVASQVLGYARADGYGKLSTHKRYSPKKGEGYWYPTPPAYMAAVEPEWRTIRPFFLDSASQFAPLPPAPFSRDSASAFYRQMMEVYEVVNGSTVGQREAASFWDCNPFAVSFSGHMAIGLKKISPGGHWMGITGIVCAQKRLPLDSAILVHTLVATTIHDGFISCWQEKYNSDRIRPETAINKYVDPAWRPLLQTPPFPEYTSGHSVVSSSAAVVLTYLIGDNFPFTDTSEIFFGLPERRFDSFWEAANEAALSRLYGGIHFRDACEQGVAQGTRIGEHVLNDVFANQP